MLPDRVWNPGPLTYESGALPIALHGPARVEAKPQPQMGSIAHSFSLSSIHCPDMTEILLKRT